MLDLASVLAGVLVVDYIQSRRCWRKNFPGFESSKESPELLLDGLIIDDLAGALWPLVVGSVDEVAYRVLPHCARFVRPEQIRYPRGVSHAWVKPQVVIFRPKDHWHPVVNFREEGIRVGR